jgi:hypothetical protein
MLTLKMPKPRETLAHNFISSVNTVVNYISEHLRTRQMLVRVLLCTLYTTCFGPDQWPSSSDLQHKIYLKAATNISTDPLSQIYKRAKAVVTVSLNHVVV